MHFEWFGNIPLWPKCVQYRPAASCNLLMKMCIFGQIWSGVTRKVFGILVWNSAYRSLGNISLWPKCVQCRPAPWWKCTYLVRLGVYVTRKVFISILLVWQSITIINNNNNLPISGEYSQRRSHALQSFLCEDDEESRDCEDNSNDGWRSM